jgi:hypothetical protein
MDKEMFLIHQGPTEPLSSYLQRFKGAVDVVKSSDGDPWVHQAATKIVYNKMYTPSSYSTNKSTNSTVYQAASTKAQRRYLAAIFFQGLSNKSQKELKKKIHNDAITGSDTVPRTYDKVLQLADQCKSSSSHHQRQHGGDRGGGIAFAQNSKAAAAAAAEKAAEKAESSTKDSSSERKPHLVSGKKDNKGKMIENK